VLKQLLEEHRQPNVRGDGQIPWNILRRWVVLVVAGIDR